MPNKKRVFSSINLAPKDEFDESVIGKAIKWALTAGRSIVILTEFVVILAFLSRFKYDRDLNDLNETVIQKQAVIESFSQIEAVARSLEDRLTLLKEIKSSDNNFSDSLLNLTEKMPFGLEIKTLRFDNEKINIEGLVSSEQQLKQVIQGLREMGYGNISVQEIEFGQRTGRLEFKMSAEKEVENGDAV